MQSSFKIRSRSGDVQVRRCIYDKIKINSQQKKWFIFLKQQLDVSLVINQLSKAQFEHNNTNKFKYAARSILMKKKDIIYQLQQQDVTAALTILEDIINKVSEYQKKKFQMIIILLNYKLKIENGYKNSNEEQLIKWLKSQINQYGSQYDSKIIKVAIMTIVTIIHIHTHGILMTTEEKLIIFKTIQLKKKIISQQSNQLKSANFQCLIYLLSEIYKIIYLLKKDQQTILSYYNQLNAYVEAFGTKSSIRSVLDIKQIHRILKSMKPILNQLNIYEDCQLRKQFAFSNLKNQILDQQDKQNHCNMEESYIFLDKKKYSRKSSIKVISTSNLLKIIRPNNPYQNNNDNIHNPNNRNNVNNIDDVNHAINNISNNTNIKCRRKDGNKKLTLMNYKSEAMYRSSNLIQKITEGILFLSEFQKQQKIIDFLTIHREKLYLIMLKLNFKNSCSILDIEIHIRRNSSQSQIYTLKGIKVLTQQKNAKKISIFIEKLFFFLFKNEGYVLELNHIEMAQEYIPHKLATEDILISIIRIKALLKHYIKIKIAYQSLIPNKFLFPNITLEQIQQQFQSQSNQNIKERLMIRKRQGRIIKQYRHVQKNNEVSVKILYKLQHQKSNSHLFFNISYIYQFKGLTIYLLSVKDQVPEVLHLAKKLQRIWYQNDIDINQKLKRRILVEVEKERIKTQQIVQVKTQFSIELQIMLNNTHNKPQIVQLKVFNDLVMERKKKTTEKKYHEMVKINNRYLLFEKVFFEHYMIYRHFKSKITLPLNWQQLGWQITTTKVRMYRSIKFLKKHGNLNLLILTSFKSDQIQFQYKQIYLKMISNRVIRKQKGYCLLLEYMTPQFQYLYEVIVNPLNRFFCLSEHRKPRFMYFNQQAYINNDKQFKYYHLGRQKLSEANHYYQNVIKNAMQ